MKQQQKKQAYVLNFFCISIMKLSVLVNIRTTSYTPVSAAELITRLAVENSVYRLQCTSCFRG